MTETEKQHIVSLVLQSLKTNSLTIEQLTAIDELPEDAFLEVSGGRKISAAVLKRMFESYLPGIDVLSSFGNRVDAVVCQDFFTRNVQGRVIGIIDLSKLDTLKTRESVGLYHVLKDESPFAELIVTSDSTGHTIIQFLFGNYIEKEDGTLSATTDDNVSIMSRIYNISALDSAIRKGTWGSWKRYGQKYMLLSEEEYSALTKPDPETFYYIYEEE